MRMYVVHWNIFMVNKRNLQKKRIKDPIVGENVYRRFVLYKIKLPESGDVW